MQGPGKTNIMFFAMGLCGVNASKLVNSLSQDMSRCCFIFVPFVLDCPQVNEGGLDDKAPISQCSANIILGRRICPSTSLQVLDDIHEVGETRDLELSLSGKGKDLVVDDLPHKASFMGMMTNRARSPFVAPRHFIHTEGCRPSIKTHEVHDDVEVVSGISQGAHEFLNHAASSQVLSGVMFHASFSAF